MNFSNYFRRKIGAIKRHRKSDAVGKERHVKRLSWNSGAGRNWRRNRSGRHRRRLREGSHKLVMGKMLLIDLQFCV